MEHRERVRPGAVCAGGRGAVGWETTTIGSVTKEMVLMEPPQAGQSSGSTS